MLSVCSVGPGDDEDKQEKTLSQVYDSLPEGCTALDILKKKDERQRIGKISTNRNKIALRIHLSPSLPLYCLLHFS